eukprot:g6993.t1
MSVEAILEKRRTSFNKAAKAVAVAAAVTAVEVAPPPEESDKHRKFKKARGMTVDITELQDADLVEILQLPTEQEVSLGAEHLVNCARRRRMFLDRTSSSDEFTEPEIDRLRKAFVKHRQPMSQEVHSDDLRQKPGGVGKYSTLEFDEFVSFMLLVRDYDRKQVREIFTQFDADGSGELSAEELES